MIPILVPAFGAFGLTFLCLAVTAAVIRDKDTFKLCGTLALLAFVAAFLCGVTP